MSNTPILDCEEPLPAVRARRRWPWLVLGVVSGAAIILMNERGIIGDVFLPADTLLFFIPALYLAVLAHELGHVVAGLAVGYELRGLSVGLFHLRKQANGWRLRLVPACAFTGGMTAMVPRSAEELARRFRLFGLGGPAGSLFLLVVTLILPGSLPVRVLLVVNLLLALAILIPHTVRGQPNDANTILILTRKNAAAERLAAILYILALDTRQVPPRDWPREFVERMGAPMDEPSFRPTALLLRFSHALDGGDPDAIADALEQALARSDEMPPELRRVFFGEAACFHGILRHDASRAEAWLQRAHKVKGAASLKDSDAKARAAIALAQGDLLPCCDLLKRFLAVLDRLPASGIVAAERARTQALLDRVAGTAATQAH